MSINSQRSSKNNKKLMKCVVLDLKVNFTVICLIMIEENYHKILYLIYIKSKIKKMLWNKIGIRKEKSVSPSSSQKDNTEVKSLNEESLSNKKYEAITQCRFGENIKHDLSKSNSKGNSLVIDKSQNSKDQIIQDDFKKIYRKLSRKQRFKYTTSGDLYEQSNPMSNSFLNKFQESQLRLYSPISNTNMKNQKTLSGGSQNEYILIKEMANPEQKKKQKFKIIQYQNKLNKYQQIVIIYKQEISRLKMELQQFLKSTKISNFQYRSMIQNFFKEFAKFQQTACNNYFINEMKVLKQKQKIILERQKQFQKMTKMKEEQFRNRWKQIQIRQRDIFLRQNKMQEKLQEMSSVFKQSTFEVIENNKIQLKILELKKKEEQLEQKKRQLNLKQTQLLMKANMVLNTETDIQITRSRRNSYNTKIQNQVNLNTPLVKRLNDMRTCLAGINICNQEFEKTLLKQSLRRPKPTRIQNF